MKLLSLLSLLLVFHLVTVVVTKNTTVSWLAKRKHVVKATPPNCQKCLAIVGKAKQFGSAKELAAKKYSETISFFLAGSRDACAKEDCRRLIGQISHIFRLDKSLANATDRQLCQAAKVCV